MTPTEILGSLFAVIYGGAMSVLALQGLHLLWLLGRWRRHRSKAAVIERGELDAPLPADGRLPTVLVQLPVYNERDVVTRLVAAVGRLDWPADRLRIQLLDDSSDDSIAIGAQAVEQLQRRGMQAVAIHRQDRTGFKAGALQAGMADDDSPFIAIFDADFVPEPDFLKRAIRPLLEDDGLALVQGRWEHLNADTNALTAAQAVGIDGHFGIEQGARAWSGLAMNFNGTGGLWRRSAIEAGGGWEHDTLTEDMDLSYRVQLAGWRCTYRRGLAVPGELPETIEAFAQQQFRWAKGSIQTACKLLPRIWRSDWGLARKLAASGHMTHYLVHPLMLVAMLAAPPALWLAPQLPHALLWAGLAAFIIGAGAPIITYVVGQLSLGRRGWRLWWQIPRLAALGTGIAISNARACYEALTGRVSPFVRTPKGGAAGSYRAGGRNGILELAAGAWAGTGILVGIQADRPWITPLLLVYASGFTWVGAQYALHRWRTWRATRPALDGDGRARRRALAALGVAALAGYGILAWWPGSWRAAPVLFATTALALGAAWLASIWIVRRSAGPLHALPLILVLALAMRIVGLGVAPSDDVHRYLVEGAQVEAWQNPYSYAPDSPQAVAVASAAGVYTPAVMAEAARLGVSPAVLEGVNHPDWTASYPPLTLFAHALVIRIASEPWAMQALAFAAELLALVLAVALLAHWRLRSDLLLVYAWCPLIPIFAGGEAHDDALMAPLLMAGVLLLGRGARGSLPLLAAAALVKPFAAWLLLPRLWAQRWTHWATAAALAVIAYLPFAGAGGGMFHSFGRFGTEKHYNGALEPLVRLLMGEVAPGHLVQRLTVVTLIGILALATLLVLRRAQAAGRLHHPATFAALAAWLLLCLPTLHPWYLILLVPLLPALAHSWGLLLWVAMAPGYWLHGVAIQANGGEWIEDPWVRTAIHLPALLVLGWEIAGRPGLPRLGDRRRLAAAVSNE